MLGGDFVGESSSSPVNVTGDHEFTLIAAGRWHTCALTPTGQTLCWGASSAGPAGKVTHVLQWCIPHTPLAQSLYSWLLSTLA